MSKRPAAPAVKTQSTAAATVIVACKIPTGIVLQLCKPTTYFEETPSGSKERTRYDKFGPRVHIRGTAYPVGQAPAGFPPRPVMVGGYALTFGVDADFFREWMKQNAMSPLVLNHQIMAHSQTSSIQAAATEHAEVRSGYEPLNPENDPRLPRAAAAGVGKIETAEEMKSWNSFRQMQREQELALAGE